MSALREIAGPFAVAPPAGARVRTRLRVSGDDAAVLREAGEYLGSLASADLAARCAEGSLAAGQRQPPPTRGQGEHVLPSISGGGQASALNSALTSIAFGS